jgi:hypothetical protein
MTKTPKFSQNTEIDKKMFLKHLHFKNYIFFEILVSFEYILYYFIAKMHV